MAENGGGRPALEVQAGPFEGAQAQPVTWINPGSLGSWSLGDRPDRDDQWSVASSKTQRPNDDARGVSRRNRARLNSGRQFFMAATFRLRYGYLVCYVLCRAWDGGSVLTFWTGLALSYT